MPASQNSGEEREASEAEPTPRKRTRTGCLPCRSRRRKCDGTRPRCRGCEARNQACRWGLKASFHPSRTINLSRREAAALRKVEEERERRPRRNQEFIDETAEILDGYSSPPRRRASPPPDLLEEEEASPGGISGHSPQLNTGPLSIGDLFAQYNPYPSDDPRTPSNGNYYLSPLTGSRHFDSAASPAAPNTHESHIYPFLLGQSLPGDTSPEPTSQLPVTEEEKVHLMSAYLRETGTWCETTDSEMHFTVKVIHKLMKSPSFVAAALSLASRQLDYVQMRRNSATLELYQFTIQLLLCQDPEQADASVLATCTLLCVYEMMASRVEEWRRHLKGCAGFLRAKKWNGSSDGIVKASFWAFARIDVWAAFNSGKATLIPTESWVDDMSIDSVLVNGTLDDYCNLAILTFAKVVNLLSTAQGPRGTRAAPMRESLYTLWDEMQTWHQKRPSEVCPLLRSHSPSKPFPEVVYTRSSPNCGQTFYHAGCMLLLQAGLRPQVTQHQQQFAQEYVGHVTWHAQEVIGISISNPSHANWVNQLQPLFIAGTVFGNSVAIPAFRDSQIPESPDIGSAGSNSDEFCREKIVLLKHLAKIERETGWKTSDRAAELRSLWGFM